MVIEMNGIEEKPRFLWTCLMDLKLGRAGLLLRVDPDKIEDS